MEYSGSSLSIESYERKINRLEIDNINLKEDLDSMMLKMKSLEEIQIKYELLLGQSQKQNQHLKLNQFLLQKKLQQQIQTLIEQKDQQCRQIVRKLQQQHKNQILQLREKHKQITQQQQQKYNQLKLNYQTLLSKSSQIDVFSFKLKKYEKLNAQLQEQLENQRMLSEQTKEKQLAEQKTTLTKKLKQKYDAEIQTYEQRIKQFTKRINQLELQNDLLNQKNKNLQLSQQTSNIDKLKQILSERKSIEKSQLSKLQQALDRANASLRKMVQQKYDIEQKYISRQDQMKNYIKDIQSQLLEQEKSHTREIFTLQQKMKAIKQQEINSLQEHINSIKTQFQAQKKIWNDLSESHNQQLQQLKQAKTRQWTQFQQQKSILKQKIKQLAKKLQEHQGKQIQSSTQQMISSFKDIDQKQDTQTKYENGLVFLQRQLRKANMMIDQKNQQIARLLKQQTNLREETEGQVSQWRQRYTQEKKQLMDRVFQLENEVRDLGDKIRLKDRQLQKSQKQTSFEKIQLQKRIQSLQDINQQLRKDYERMVVANKAIQAQYRGQRDRGVSAVGDATYAKRMKWFELQKQKNQLNIVFREKEEQLKIFYERQIDQLRKERDTLKQKATLLEDEKNNLKQEHDKLLKKTQNNKENSMNGKKKSGDMEKKLASLNLQIALTKNLFENLQKAKSRLKSRQLTERINEERMNDENKQQQY